MMNYNAFLTWIRYIRAYKNCVGFWACIWIKYVVVCVSSIVLLGNGLKAINIMKRTGRMWELWELAEALMKYQLEKRSNVPRNYSATDVEHRMWERRMTWDEWSASHTDEGEVLDVSWRRLKNISKNTRSAWEPHEASDAFLSSLTPPPLSDQTHLS